MLSLIPILESIDDEKLYTTPFIDAMKELAIMLNREAFNWCFLPFMLQVASSVTYFNFIALNENPDRTFFYWLLEFIVLLTTIYFLVIEFFQMKTQKLKYLYGTTNIIDYSQIVTNILIVINEIKDRNLFSQDAKSYIIAGAVLCLWIRTFYWMRVFKRPAFFILLIKKTLSGIGPFLTLLGIIIVLFSNILFVLNVAQNVMNPVDKTTLYPEDASGSSFWNAVIHGYLISLGDFETENYENRG